MPTKTTAAGHKWWMMPLLYALTRWRQWITPRSTQADEAFRERTIRIISPFITFAIFVFLTLAVLQGAIGALWWVFVIALLGNGAVVWAVHNRHVVIAGWAFVALANYAALISLIHYGYWSPSGMQLLIFAILGAAVLLPRLKGAILQTGISMLLYAMAALWAHSQGIVSPLGKTASFSNPFSAIVLFSLILSLFTLVGYYLIRQFYRQQDELKQLIGTLEERVAIRTRDLEIASDVSRQVTKVLDLRRLLNDVVEHTGAGFGLYHVSIFRYDTEHELLALEAATGTVGRQMISKGKYFALDAKYGLVPQAARTKEVIVINDVSRSQEHIINSLLPNTRAEAVFPMTIETSAGTHLVGVLDLQAEEIDRFSADDVRILTTLAEQIAIAIRNAQLIEDAQKARAEAEEANRVKSQFLAAMSHELRTPLNAVINFTQFVSSGMLGPVNDEQVNILVKVVDSGKHLLNLINDVLDISKIESGALKLFVETDVDICKEAQFAADTARSLLDGRASSVALVVDIPEELPPLIGDRRRVRQIMLNLVSNACKFTDEGSITLRLWQESQNIVFAVHDTGPGIAPEDHALVFETFKQTEAGLRQGQGTGLGLPISCKLAEAHGGRLWFESTPGRGSRFFVSFPLRAEKLIPQIKEKTKIT